MSALTVIGNVNAELSFILAVPTVWCSVYARLADLYLYWRLSTSPLNIPSFLAGIPASTAYRTTFALLALVLDNSVPVFSRWRPPANAEQAVMCAYA